MNTLHRRLATAFGLALMIALAGHGVSAQAPVPAAREPQGAPTQVREGQAREAQAQSQAHESQAREGQSRENQASRPDSRPDRPVSSQRLPADATTEHTLELP